MDLTRRMYGDYVCSKCGKFYKSLGTLQRHLNYECGLAPRFKCPYCNYFTKQKINVKKHIVRNHNDKSIYVIDTTNTDTPFGCD